MAPHTTTLQHCYTHVTAALYLFLILVMAQHIPQLCRTHGPCRLALEHTHRVSLAFTMNRVPLRGPQLSFDRFHSSRTRLFIFFVDIQNPKFLPAARRGTDGHGHRSAARVLLWTHSSRSGCGPGSGVKPGERSACQRGVRVNGGRVSVLPHLPILLLPQPLRLSSCFPPRTAAHPARNARNAMDPPRRLHDTHGLPYDYHRGGWC